MSHLSFAGQTEIDYCVECCIKHGQTAKVLAREGLQRAEANNPAGEGVKEKIRGVIEELSGFEDDTETVQNENVTALNTAARDLRKYIYSSKAEIGGADIETLREIKNRIDSLVDQAYMVREQEEICVPCVSPLVCKENKDECVAFLEEAAESGDTQKFSKAVEEAKKKYGKTTPPEEQIDVESYGVEAAKKRKQFLEELKTEASPE